MLNSIANTGLSAIQNALLITTNVAVAATVTGLVALTLIEHFDDTPEIRTLACAVGLQRDDCPSEQRALMSAEERVAELNSLVAALEAKLDGFKGVQDSGSTFTIFTMQEGEGDRSYSFDQVHLARPA